MRLITGGRRYPIGELLHLIRTELAAGLQQSAGEVISLTFGAVCRMAS